MNSAHEQSQPSSSTRPPDTIPGQSASNSTSQTRRRSATRSPSPKITFSPTSFEQGKGVQNITRQVIRRLSSLQHVEVLEMQLENENEHDHEHDDGDEEASSADVTPMTDSPPRRGSPELERKVHANGSANKSAKATNGHTDAVKKIDWEIPRKVLHSSIGVVTLYQWATKGSPKTIVLVLWTAFAVIMPVDILRLRWPAFEQVYERVLGFLMRESEKKSTNGVIWYILGVNFALTFYPPDVATVAILILSWADTAASTFGRLWGRLTPPLPQRLPFLRLPLAPRKSLAGFIAAAITGAAIAFGFWRWVAPIRGRPEDVSWTMDGGVASNLIAGWHGVDAVTSAGSWTKGWLGLGVITVIAGIVSGVAEALGEAEFFFWMA
ncbi:hypothetical protein HGRIS_012574 [Hohenbuehelia grisea]|uniref:Phosphatidate cytidylyltransferase n=1 Tax=Hohenbuehelia grisea TaxID=104357 RepID=A0ABR3ISN8_9AGAR